MPAMNTVVKAMEPFEKAKIEARERAKAVAYVYQPALAGDATRSDGPARGRMCSTNAARRSGPADGLGTSARAHVRANLAAVCPPNITGSTSPTPDST
jgi:hypothetical protein